MNICANSACQVLKTNQNQALVSDLGNRQVDKTTQAAAQTTFQRFSSFFSEPAAKFGSYSLQISPLNVITSSAQTIKGMGKLALVAALISWQIVPQVAASRLQISAPSTYTVMPGANVTLNNPPISISGALFGEDIDCVLFLPAPIQGTLFLPSLSPTSYQIIQSRKWGYINNQESINAAYQNLLFQGNLINISTNLGVHCESFTHPGQGINATATVLLTGSYPKQTTIAATTIGSETLANTLIRTTITPIGALSSKSSPTSESQLTPFSASSALQTQSVASKLLSSITTFALGQSQNIATGMFVTSAMLLAPTSQIETQFDPLQKSSPDDFNRFGWIIVAIAGVLLCAGGLTVVGILVRKKSKAKAVEEGVIGKEVLNNQQNGKSNQYDIVPRQHMYAGMPLGQQANNCEAANVLLGNGNQNGSNILPNVYQQPDSHLNSGNTIVANDPHNGPNPYIDANAAWETQVDSSNQDQSRRYVPARSPNAAGNQNNLYDAVVIPSNESKADF